LSRKANHDNFIVNRSGAVIVEFVFVVFIITLFIKVLISVTAYQATVGKLDRISYSIAGIVRERERVYGVDNALTEPQVRALKQLAEKMLVASGIPNASPAITVETLHFDPESETKTVDTDKTLSFSIGVCQPTRALSDMTDLSPYSNSVHWIPLYQVTLCLPTAPWYSAIFSRGESTIPIKSSAMTIER
jgi:tight adherence protein F